MTHHLETPTQLRERMQAKVRAYTAAQCEHAIADCHDTLRLWRDVDSPYTRQLWAEVDALRERLQGLRARKPASWVVRERATARVLFETFDARVVDALNAERYEAVPILEYLQALNARA